MYTLSQKMTRGDILSNDYNRATKNYIMLNLNSTFHSKITYKRIKCFIEDLISSLISLKIRSFGY